MRAATLLIVGGNDPPVIEFNQAALAELRTEKQIEIVPGASHLFEEPGALEDVAQAAREWFTRYLTPADAGSPTPADQPGWSERA